MCGNRACAAARPSVQIRATVAVCGGTRGSNLAARAGRKAHLSLPDMATRARGEKSFGLACEDFEEEHPFQAVPVVSLIDSTPRRHCPFDGGAGRLVGLAACWAGVHVLLHSLRLAPCG